MQASSVQAELDDLFAQLEDPPVRVRTVTNQAFSKARQDFRHPVLFAAAAAIFFAHIVSDLHMGRYQLQLFASFFTHHVHLFLPGAELTLHAKSDGFELQMLFEALDNLEPCQDIL